MQSSFRMSSSTNGSPSHIFTAHRFMCMLMLLGSCWSLRFISATKKKARASNPSTCASSRLAGRFAPVKLLAEAGIDVTQAEFWQGGYDIIASMVSRLESL